MATTLVVETGSVVTGANSFVTLAEADAYHVLGGNTAWTGTDEAKEAALVKAGRYLNGLAWKGRKTAFENPMSWPRFNVVDPDSDPIENITASHPAIYTSLLDSSVIPQAVKAAQCEAALKILAGTDMQPDLARGGQMTRKKTDVLETEWAPGAPARTNFTAITDALRGLLKGSGAIELRRG